MRNFFIVGLLLAILASSVIAGEVTKDLPSFASHLTKVQMAGQWGLTPRITVTENNEAGVTPYIVDTQVDNPTSEAGFTTVYYIPFNEGRPIGTWIQPTVGARGYKTGLEVFSGRNTADYVVVVSVFIVGVRSAREAGDVFDVSTFEVRKGVRYGLSYVIHKNVVPEAPVASVPF